jgi:hypothetical protein
MVSENSSQPTEALSAEAYSAADVSSLRAIFEILSYVHADARDEGFLELADRIEFALNAAENALATEDGGASS